MLNLPKWQFFLFMCRFFRICGMELTCLRMACCRFVDGLVLASIANNCPNLEGLSYSG